MPVWVYMTAGAVPGSITIRSSMPSWRMPADGALPTYRADHGGLGRRAVRGADDDGPGGRADPRGRRPHAPERRRLRDRQTPRGRPGSDGLSRRYEVREVGVLAERRLGRRV